MKTDICRTGNSARKLELLLLKLFLKKFTKHKFSTWTFILNVVFSMVFSSDSYIFDDKASQIVKELQN